MVYNIHAANVFLCAEKCPRHERDVSVRCVECAASGCLLRIKELAGTLALEHYSHSRLLMLGDSDWSYSLCVLLVHALPLFINFSKLVLVAPHSLCDKLVLCTRGLTLVGSSIANPEEKFMLRLLIHPSL